MRCDVFQDVKRQHDEKIAEEIKEYEEMRREERQKQEEEIRTLRERKVMALIHLLISKTRK